MSTSSMSEADAARGARVELALDAALRGNPAMAIGMLAGMSAEERGAFGPLITAAALSSTHSTARFEDLFRKDVFGSAAMDRADASAGDGLNIPTWINQ